MEKYATMLYGTFDLDELTPEERIIFKEMQNLAKGDPKWWDLGDIFSQRLEEMGVLKKRTGYQYAFYQPLCRIYSDIELRLCLRLQEKRKAKKEKPN